MLIFVLGRFGCRDLFFFASFCIILAAPDRVAAAADCSLKQIASIPASFKNNQILVDVAINGTPAKFLIDTGAVNSAVSIALANRLKLPNRQLYGEAEGVGGSFDLNGVIISEFKLGGLVAKGDLFNTTPTGGDGTTDRFAGIIGDDYLFNYEVELDPSLERVNLFSPEHCPDTVVYWYDSHFELPVTNYTGDSLRSHVTLDGNDLDALIDTGATVSVLDLRTAQTKLDVQIDSSFKPDLSVRGVDGKVTVSYQHVFDTLVFGPITLRHPKLTLLRFGKIDADPGSHVKGQINDSYSVIIGMDVLRVFHFLTEAYPELAK